MFYSNIYDPVHNYCVILIAKDPVKRPVIPMVAVTVANMIVRDHRKRQCVIVMRNVKSMATVVWTLTSYASESHKMFKTDVIMCVNSQIVNIFLFGSFDIK